MKEVEALKDEKRNAEQSYRNSMPRNDFQFSYRFFLMFHRYKKRCSEAYLKRIVTVLFFNNNVFESVKFALLIWKISMEFMTMTKDLQIIMEANFTLVLLILGVACKLL